jgi:hypothetical protein
MIVRVGSPYDEDMYSIRQDERSSAPSCSEIFYQDYYPGQKRLFLKEKGAWNFQKWGKDGERFGMQKNKGLSCHYLTPCFNYGADEQDRTADLLITNQLLYRLSYIGFAYCSDSTSSKDLPIYSKKFALSRFSCTGFRARAARSSDHSRRRKSEKGVCLDFRGYSDMIYLLCL